MGIGRADVAIYLGKIANLPKFLSQTMIILTGLGYGRFWGHHDQEL
jgi:hypothetical protein